MQKGSLTLAAEKEPEILDRGLLRWLSNSPSTGAARLTVIDVTLEPGKAHDSHMHPDQEEVLYVVGGRVEPWVDRQRKLLGPGDSAFLPAGIVHASFNVGAANARLVAILGPCQGDTGYELVDMASQEP